MGAKKVTIDTDQHKGRLFKVTESSGRYYVYAVDIGFICNDQKKLGEARNMTDALEIVKASVSGTVRNVKITEW
jgi:hypothetical protein